MKKNNAEIVLIDNYINHEVYQFSGRQLVPIRTRTNDQPRYVDTRNDHWEWFDGGIKFSIDWTALNLSPGFIPIAKGYLSYSLEKNAPRTSVAIVQFLKRFSTLPLSKIFPWSENEILNQLSLWFDDRQMVIVFRRLYDWGLGQGIYGFNTRVNLLIAEVKTIKVQANSRVFLGQIGLSEFEEINLIQRISTGYNLASNSWRDNLPNIILHLGFELGLRSIQYHALDVADFEEVKPNDISFFTIWLPMAKKIGEQRPQRRPRKISNDLGLKLKLYILKLQEAFGETIEPLFVDRRGNRLSVERIATILKGEHVAANIRHEGQVSMLLRHHLGQGLADQGAPAEMIAELLGHNSTIAAQAYVAATPNIAKIKSKALGKSEPYKRIMAALLTGDVVKKDDVNKNSHVHGIVNMTYIGGIGSCALPSPTCCPYNPVYSCYTCKKFHPFVDGPHGEVKLALQDEAQYFLDAAEQVEGSLEYNRAVTQHERTIFAVNATIDYCKKEVL
ncbi:tyrosine-type recombinase/integrase [Deefgea sp. CFH1-16]|nr:tyrosine-type recombinase/integrase [Deefgea sp. CFH1-16]